MNKSSVSYHSGKCVRIAGVSGSASDRRTSISRFAANHPNDPIDVIIGDWMSEANMTHLASRKVSQTNSPAAAKNTAYEAGFLESLVPALPDIAKYGIKVAVNAGALDTELLYKDLVSILESQNISLKVAWISGDEVLPTLLDLHRTTGGPNFHFENMYTGEKLSDWSFKPIYAQAYLGGLGIAAAFQNGADIVICGRVSDASPVIGAAAWYHSWNSSPSEHFHHLANSLVTGHLIECSTYVTGGNFSGFRTLEKEGKWLDIGFPIAEISEDGSVVITKMKGTGGLVSVDTCKAQLLYEIQGPWYFNSDVTAILDSISLTQIGPDRVALGGIQSGPPPPTTKVGITAQGGYQAEVHFFLVGLDIAAKARMVEAQVRHELSSQIAKDALSVLDFQIIGTPAPNSNNQNSATSLLRIVAQARKEEDLSPRKFHRPITDLIMSSYPGSTFHLDPRLGFPRPIYEYYVTLFPQQAIQHMVHLQNGRSFEIPPPSVTRTYPSQQPSYDRPKGIGPSSVGQVVRGPLGLIVNARSGDKGSNCNVGLWVAYEDEWDWLSSLLNIEKIKELLGEEYNGKQIDRFELPNIYAVHFLLHDHLDRGVSCTSTLDFLGKNVAEFLRARHVDLPVKFLKRRNLKIEGLTKL